MATAHGKEKPGKTQVSIQCEKFFINGKPTFEGRIWQGYPIEGLLPNSRMMQGIFDDLNYCYFGQDEHLKDEQTAFKASLLNGSSLPNEKKRFLKQ